MPFNSKKQRPKGKPRPSSSRSNILSAILNKEDDDASGTHMGSSWEEAFALEFENVKLNDDPPSGASSTNSKNDQGIKTKKFSSTSSAPSSSSASASSKSEKRQDELRMKDYDEEVEAVLADSGIPYPNPVEYQELRNKYLPQFNPAPTSSTSSTLALSQQEESSSNFNVKKMTGKTRTRRMATRSTPQPLFFSASTLEGNSYSNKNPFSEPSFSTSNSTPSNNNQMINTVTSRLTNTVLEKAATTTALTINTTKHTMYAKKLLEKIAKSLEAEHETLEEVAIKLSTDTENSENEDTPSNILKKTLLEEAEKTVLKQVVKLEAAFTNGNTTTLTKKLLEEAVKTLMEKAVILEEVYSALPTTIMATIKLIKILMNGGIKMMLDRAAILEKAAADDAALPTITTKNPVDTLDTDKNSKPRRKYTKMTAAAAETSQNSRIIMVEKSNSSIAIADKSKTTQEESTISSYLPPPSKISDNKILKLCPLKDSMLDDMDESELKMVKQLNKIKEKNQCLAQGFEYNEEERRFTKTFTYFSVPRQRPKTKVKEDWFLMNFNNEDLRQSKSAKKQSSIEVPSFREIVYEPSNNLDELERDPADDEAIEKRHWPLEQLEKKDRKNFANVFEWQERKMKIEEKKEILALERAKRANRRNGVYNINDFETESPYPRLEDAQFIRIVKAVPIQIQIFEQPQPSSL